MILVAIVTIVIMVHYNDVELTYFNKFLKRGTKMAFNILNRFNVINRNILCGITLALLTSLSAASTQGDLNLSSSAQEMLKFLNDPQNKNDILNNPQTQNDNELVMFIMKSIEDKHIKEINKKVEFVNSFKVSNDIKEQAISYINQNLTYSDNEKASYGIYMLKKCNTIPRAGACYPDYRPDGRGGCTSQRSNICCN